MEDNRNLGRFASRNRKPRETYIGTDSTGAEYWLVPYSESSIPNRKFEIRNSQKHVPAMLQGMITDAGTAERLFEKWQQCEKAKKSASAAASKAKKAEAE